jgi:hypothetical protein
VRTVITVDGSDADRAALQEWLERERALRGNLGVEVGALPGGAMGVPGELVVQVAATVAGAGAVWAALARSVSVWLVQRRSDVSVTITGPSGRTVTVDAKRVPDAEQLIRAIADVAKE